MVIRQTSQREERRRRVLVDERRESSTAASPGPAREGEGSGRPARRYTEAAAREQQPRICDLIPSRPWAVLVWLLVCATLVVAHGALEAAYQVAGRGQLGIDLTPLSLSQPHNLARQSLCLSLLVATVYAALVLNFRRHRIDDYRGRYRLWYFICAGLLCTALLLGSGLSHTLHSSLTWLLASGGISPQPSWKLASLLLVAVVVGGRYWLEIRESRGAVACLLACGLVAACGATLQSQAGWFPGEEFRQMLSGLAELATVQLALLSLVVYSRYVLLDAQGLIDRAAQPKRSRRLRLSGLRRAGNGEAPAKERAKDRDKERDKEPPKERAKEPAKERAKEPAKEPAAEAAAPPPEKRPAAPLSRRQPPAERQDAEEMESDDEPSTVMMSRADRRRLRKEQRRQQRAA